MSSAQDQKHFLFDVYTEERSYEVEVDNLDVYFPDVVAGWSDVLDCRPEPYSGQSIHDNCHFAQHVHKKFILVSQSQIDHEALPSD